MAAGKRFAAIVGRFILERRRCGRAMNSLARNRRPAAPPAAQPGRLLLARALRHF